MSGEESVIASAAYPYTDEVIVEVTCRDDEGHLVVHSYQFEYDDHDDHLSPKGGIEPEHESAVEEALAEKDYELGGARRQPGT